MDQFIEEENVLQALENWKNKEITIQKQQSRDIDVITMKLDDVKFVSRKGTIDDYVSPLVIQLHGTGNIVKETTKGEVLPQSRFEIPIDDLKNIRMDNRQINILAEDKEYTIKMD